MEKTLRVIAECFANRYDELDLLERSESKNRRNKMYREQLRLRKMIILDLGIALTSASIKLGKEK